MVRYQNVPLLLITYLSGPRLLIWLEREETEICFFMMVAKLQNKEHHLHCPRPKPNIAANGLIPT
jgi:hypothetical protein